MTAREMAPETLGPYRLLARLGEGGMGVVYLAADATDQRVAVKALRPGVAEEPNARRRLAREVETMRRVRSPFVAEVVDADVSGDPPYIVTRYVDGPTLDQVVTASGPLRGADLASLAQGLAAALAAVHAAGVVHRDLKPGNVMLCGGEPVVIDFGIAQASEATKLTMTGMFMGTPGFLAPELIEGRQCGPAADVHAWGATVAAAATGRPPFGGGTFEAIFYRIVHGEPDLDGVPATLRPLLAEALARDPALRPSAADLQARLAMLDPAALVSSVRTGDPPCPPVVGTRADVVGALALRRSTLPLTEAAIAGAAPRSAAPGGAADRAPAAGGAAAAAAGKRRGGPAVGEPASDLARAPGAAARVPRPGGTGAGGSVGGQAAGAQVGGLAAGAPAGGLAAGASAGGPGAGVSGSIPRPARPGAGMPVGAAGAGMQVGGAGAGVAVADGAAALAAGGVAAASLAVGTAPQAATWADRSAGWSGAVAAPADYAGLLPPVQYLPPSAPSQPRPDGRWQQFPSSAGSSGARLGRAPGVDRRPSESAVAAAARVAAERQAAEPAVVPLLVAAAVIIAVGLSVVFPVAGAAAALLLLMTLRAGDATSLRLAARRLRRGSVSGAAFRRALIFPAELAASALRCVLLAPVALVAAGLAAAITVIVVPVNPLPRAAAYGAGALIACYGFGPGSRPARRPLRAFFGTVAATPASAVATTLITGAVALAAVAAAVASPAIYWPLSHLSAHLEHLQLVHSMVNDARTQLLRLVGRPG